MIKKIFFWGSAILSQYGQFSSAPKLHRVISGFCGLVVLLGLPGTSFSDELVVLKEFRVELIANDAKTCRANLLEFSGVCDAFEKPSWEETYGYPFWKRGTLSGARGDIDNDGTEDLILRVGHSGYCGTAGCSNLFLFGDLSDVEVPHSYGIVSLAPVISLVLEAGTRQIRFEPNAHLFSVTAIRQKTVSSKQFDLGE